MGILLFGIGNREAAGRQVDDCGWQCSAGVLGGLSRAPRPPAQELPETLQPAD